MTDKSSFTDDRWHALTDAPVAIMLAVAFVGDHGPISMMKESAAVARLLTQPGSSGPADLLISQIAPEAKDKQARHDAKQHKGATVNVVVDALVADVQAASNALDGIPADEATQVRLWFYDIAAAVADAAKGIKPAEQELLDRLAVMLDVTPG